MSDIGSVTYQDAVAVTKSDSQDDVSGPFAGLLCTATGNVVFVTPSNNTITLNSLAANAIVPIACKRVNSTNTTATVAGLLALPFKRPLNPGAGLVQP
jgi:hypothetical protein